MSVRVLVKHLATLTYKIAHFPTSKMENESYELKCGTENKYGPTSAAEDMTPCWFFSPEQARFIFTRL